MQQLAALVAGLGFTCVERLLTMGPAGRYLEATFKANKDLPARQIRPAVHQAATNLVGLLHVLIVVGHLPSACSAHKHGTPVTYDSSLTLSGSSSLLTCMHRERWWATPKHMSDQLWWRPLQVPLAVSVLLDPRMIKDRLYGTTPTSTTMLAVASGYFVHDLVICAIQLQTWGPAYLFHALFCSLLYCYGFFSQVLHYYGKHHTAACI